MHKKHNGDLCIRASSKQLKNTNHSSIPLYRKIGAALVISLLSLTGFKATAQEEQHNGDLDYILTTKDSKKSQITIKGRIKLKGINGDKVSSENIILKVFTRTQSSVRKVKEIHLSKKGVFKIELEKILLNEGFFISISEEEYLNKPIILDHLPVKDIKIKGPLDKERIFFMVGRFF